MDDGSDRRLRVAAALMRLARPLLAEAGERLAVSLVDDALLELERVRPLRPRSPETADRVDGERQQRGGDAPMDRRE